MKTAMKVAVIRQRYTPFGGAERFVERALGALVKEGAEVTLIARQWEGTQEPTAGYRRLLLDPPYPRFFGGRAARDRSFAVAVRQIMRAGGFDITQSHERIPGCMIFRAGDGLHAAWLDRRGAAQSPLARRFSRLDPYHRYVLAQEAAMFADPALRAVICNSTLVRDECRHYYGLPADKLVVIENGVDLDVFHPGLAEKHRSAMRRTLGIADDAPLFVYVGGGFARKGVPRLLEAMAAMRFRDAHLVVVGGDRKLNAMQRLSARLGIAARVHFVGRQPDVKPYLGAADAFVLPTLYDPMPNAALEAMASGLPTITSTGCGIAARIRAGENGFVCDALDISALTRHMDALASPGVAAGMRAAAREAVADLSLDAMAGQLLALYRRLA